MEIITKQSSFLVVYDGILKKFNQFSVLSKSIDINNFDIISVCYMFLVLTKTNILFRCLEFVL